MRCADAIGRLTKEKHEPLNPRQQRQRHRAKFAKGKTAPRVTPADLQANIASEHYFTAMDGVVGHHGGDPGIVAGTPTSSPLRPPDLLRAGLAQRLHRHRRVGLRQPRELRRRDRPQDRPPERRTEGLAAHGLPAQRASVPAHPAPRTPRIACAPPTRPAASTAESARKSPAGFARPPHGRMDRQAACQAAGSKSGRAACGGEGGAGAGSKAARDFEVTD